MNLTITGNTIADPGQFGSWGILGQAGAASGDAGLVCAAISGNSMTGSAQAGQGGADFEIDQEFGSTVKLPGYTGAPATPTRWSASCRATTPAAAPRAASPPSAAAAAGSPAAQAASR